MRTRTALLLGWMLFSIVALACAPAVDAPSPAPSAIDDDAAASAPLLGDDSASGDDGAGGGVWTGPSFDAGSPTDDDASVSTVPLPEGAPPPADSAPDGACTGPLGAGDLVVDELMIESVAGAGDYGEWLEIASMLPCTADLRGLHGEAPAGAKVRTFDVGFDLWLPPGARLLVADSDDPAINHDLPGMVLTWAGQPGDVLRNQGGTFTLTIADTIVDSITWPAYKGPVGVSLELPDDCPPGNEADFSLWQPASSSWFPGFRGTPGAPNTDVSCP